MNTDIDGRQINECTKWHGDGFKCVVADDCVDGYFDNSGGVPAIRGDEDDYVDVDEVSYHYPSLQYLVPLLHQYLKCIVYQIFYTYPDQHHTLDKSSKLKIHQKISQD